MTSLKVTIVRIVDREWPGWVECEFVDAFGKRHTLADKLPIFSADDGVGACPTTGVARCRVLSRYTGPKGYELVQIDTSVPDGIESKEGTSQFTVLPSQLTEDAF